MPRLLRVACKSVNGKLHFSEALASKMGTHVEVLKPMGLQWQNSGHWECELLRGMGIGRGGWDLGSQRQSSWSLSNNSRKQLTFPSPMSLHMRPWQSLGCSEWRLRCLLYSRHPSAIWLWACSHLEWNCGYKWQSRFSCGSTPQTFPVGTGRIHSINTQLSQAPPLSSSPPCHPQSHS